MTAFHGIAMVLLGTSIFVTHMGTSVLGIDDPLGWWLYSTGQFTLGATCATALLCIPCLHRALGLKRVGGMR